MPISLKTSPSSEDVSYMDGSMNFIFNQGIKHTGDIIITGKDFERITHVTTAGSALTVTYEGLNANTDYTLTFPEGSISSMDGSKTLEADIRFSFSTCDFGALDNIKDTHKGRAAALPINFKPFDEIGLLEREDGSTQENSNEHPHWVQVSGEKTAEKAVFTKTSDKIMTFYQTPSPAMRLKADYSGNNYVEFKIQETRNAAVTPSWRTSRVLRAEDFPFDDIIPLNSESRFIKLTAPVLSGNVTVYEFRVADEKGTGLDKDIDLSVTDFTAGNTVSVEYFTLSGKRTTTPPQGICLMRTIKNNGTVFIKKVTNI